MSTFETTQGISNGGRDQVVVMNYARSTRVCTSTSVYVQMQSTHAHVWDTQVLLSRLIVAGSGAPSSGCTAVRENADARRYCRCSGIRLCNYGCVSYVNKAVLIVKRWDFAHILILRFF